MVIKKAKVSTKGESNSDSMQWSRRYRPATLHDMVVGNPEILGEAKLAIKKTVAMLIAGEFGVGKTTLARALALEINGDQQSTIEEPSTERGKAYIERLQERIKFSPRGKKWVVIIDECHLLTKDAFSALLKLIEDPPHAKVLFILCTNRAHKVPKEIVSRCKFLSIEKPSMEDAASYLHKILEDTKLHLDKKQIRLLIRKAITDANFGMRQAIENLESLHDKIKSGATVDKLLSNKNSTANDDTEGGEIEQAAGAMLRAVFMASDDLPQSINYIMSAFSSVDPDLTVERMAGVLYYGYIMNHGGKWNWQSKPYKAIFNGITVKPSLAVYILDSLTTLHERLKNTEVDQAIIASAGVSNLAIYVAKLNRK